MSSALFIIGLIVIVAGLALAARYLNVPDNWIGVAVVILLGIGLLIGSAITRRRDRS